jgi:AhpD family alkylhydroperoxidase
MLTLARKPELVKALVGMLGAVFGPGTVTPEIKRLAAFGVSHAAGCQYCVAHMTHGAEHEGMAKDKIADLCEVAPKTLTAAEQAVVRVARDRGRTAAGQGLDRWQAHIGRARF